MPNLSPYFLIAFGDRIIPERSASSDVSGAKRWARWIRTVWSSTTSTDFSGASSPAREDVFSVRCRSSDVLTAAASNALPSLKRIPVRRPIVTVLPSLDTFGSPDASCGTTFRPLPTS